MLKYCMPECAPEIIKEMAHNWEWSTMNGNILKIEEMRTSHIFNCMKMYWNHWAIETGLPTVWFTNKYTDISWIIYDMPDRIAKDILFLLWNIEWRDDLPSKYDVPYFLIKKAIFNIKSAISIGQILDNLNSSLVIK